MAAIGFGVGSTVHPVPSQRSASVNCLPALFRYWPTAMQALAAEHETPYRVLPVAPVGFGVGSIVHLLPFQCSARVIDRPALLR
jgi:hypothetical protein